MSRAKSSKSKGRRSNKPLTGDDVPLFDGKWKRIRGRTAAVAPEDEEEMEWEDEDETSRRQSWWDSRPIARAWNFLIGVSLLPFCWIFTEAIFNAFAHAGKRASTAPFWQTHEFLMFGLGGALWMAWFVVCICIWRQPRPLTLYVWGHELMHVLTARIFGGRISDYEISRDGGYIVTDRYNFLIALAPYLWPFASVPVLAIWGIVGWMPEALYHREWFLGALGFTWMFHLSFTAWMIPIGQTDFTGPGRTFSVTLIYLANVILLSGCLVGLAREVTLRGYWRELYASGLHFYQQVIHWGQLLLDRVATM